MTRNADEFTVYFCIMYCNLNLNYVGSIQSRVRFDSDISKKISDLIGENI